MMYLHELVRARGGIQLPTPPAPPQRDPDLEARVKRLKAEQANREYANMVQDVNAGGCTSATNTLLMDPGEMKVVKSQLAAICNLVLTVAGSFAFTYLAVEYSLPQPDVTVQVFTALLVALLVATADLYFLMKQLNQQG